MGNTALNPLTSVGVEILSRVPLLERDPYTVRATSKFICSLYDDPEESVWLLLLPPAEDEMSPHLTTQQARRQCNERLRALVLDALPQSKVGGYFVQSGFRTLDLSRTYIETLPASKRAIHFSFTSNSMISSGIIPFRVLI